ncbi:hypothetical protein Tsubulata_019069, partial [Turnera subulata]
AVWKMDFPAERRYNSSNFSPLAVIPYICGAGFNCVHCRYKLDSHMEKSASSKHISQICLGISQGRPSKLAGMFAMRTAKLTAFTRVTSDGELVVVDKINQAAVVSDSFQFVEGQEASALVQHGGNGVKLANDWNCDLLREEIKMDQHRGTRTDRTYGFRALIVMEDHSLLLLQQGEIVWRREDSLASTLPVAKEGVSVAKVEQNLFEWLQFLNHHAMDENPSVLVVGRCRQGSDAPGVLSFVDTYTGREINSVTLAHTVAQVIPLPFTDSTEQRLHLLVDNGGQAHLYPKTPEAIGIFQHEFSNIYWYSVDSDNGIIRGLALKSNCIPLRVVHSQAKVIVDQDAMYKYLSKNLLLVATITPKASGPIGSATPEESSLVDNKAVWKLILGKHNLTHPFLHILGQKSQQGHRVTSTAKGITAKQLLIGTIGDQQVNNPQVLALDKPFLDPRRSINPTQAEKEEGIIPLTDSLPIILQTYVTHNLKVEGLRGVLTVPAKLESTTLIFSYGVDLFFTRLVVNFLLDARSHPYDRTI